VGALPALYKALRYPLVRAVEENRKKKMLRSTNIEERFTEIYRTNYWGSEESVSGPGSTLECTVNLRRHLPELFAKFDVRSVFDAPCGDFNWMKVVVSECAISYTGADIVRPLIESHIGQYQNEGTQFLHLDITKEAFPKADLWMCRDCLFHLSFEDTLSAFRRFVDSGISYLLTTTHKNPAGIENAEIKSGESRFMDLCGSPYFLPAGVLFRIDDHLDSATPTEMCLWSREQVARGVVKFEATLRSEAQSSAGGASR
jgi:hypothetical protein